MSLTVIEGGGNIVHRIEELLNDAKAGKLDGFAYATFPAAGDDVGVVGFVSRAEMQYPTARGISGAYNLLVALQRADPRA